MTVVSSNHLGKNILKLLRVEDSNVIEAHIHIVVNNIMVIDIKRYVTRENGELILTEDEKEIATEMKKYHLVEIEEEKRPEFEPDYHMEDGSKVK